VPLGRANSWSARSSTGQTFAGTWTATEDRKSGAVTGTWTLIGPRGTPIASGGWSAAKSASGWKGSWRAVAIAHKDEYAGTWTSSVDLKPDATFGALFEKAAAAAVGGTWQTGRQSGAWSIQVFKSTTGR